MNQEVEAPQSEEERIRAESEWFKKTFEGVTYCFCNQCKHSEDYGLCDKCRCGNKDAVRRKAEKEAANG